MSGSELMLVGGVPAVAANYIEDVFSTYLYTGIGAGSELAINNGVDLLTNGGLVWSKSRSNSQQHWWFDTARGMTYTDAKSLDSASTAAQASQGTNYIKATTTGYTLGTDAGATSPKTNNYTYASWTFRKQPKFFDIVTYTGNGSNNRAISHNLGSTPGCVIIKCTSTGSTNWPVFHRSTGANTIFWLNATNANTSNTDYFPTAPNGTSFYVGTETDVNSNGATYVAYLFAHDAGGFGDAGSDNVITCGSYTTDGSGKATINLGYEPQWLLVKGSSFASNWFIVDTMRGLNATSLIQTLYANSSVAEDTDNTIGITSTGFTATTGSSLTFIYIAIRRGPMKTPTSGTDVFYPQTISQADSIDSTGVPFPPDLVNTFSRNGTQRTTGYTLFQFADRLRSLGTPDDSYGTTKEGKALVSSGTDAEYGNLTNYSYIQLKADGRNITRSNGWNSASYGNWLNYFWRRAPGFFDVVCYTGTGSATTITHNLKVAPELLIVKRRDGTVNWVVWASAPTPQENQYALNLNTAGSWGSAGDKNWGSTTSGTPNMTSTTFSIGDYIGVNASGGTYVAYLFASVSGVSKVGSYTGNGSSQTINCNFTNGARFILIKRTDSSGNWFVYDSARGIVSGNDPQLKLNSTAAEDTGYDAIDPDNSGFIVNNDATNFPINVNNATYLYLAIA